MGRSALVTGAGGFIGRRLASRLVALGWNVSCVSRHDPCIIGTTFIPIVRFAEPELSSLLRGFEADVVFHLAAYGVAPTDRDPTEMFAVNVAGTAAVVSAAAAIGAKAVIYAGSCAEYAEANCGQMIVESHPLVADNLYGVSKASGGSWARALACHLKIGFLHLRIFGVYGPGEGPHRMLPSIFSGLAREGAVRLSTGCQVRDLLHVDDAVEGILCAERSAGPGSRGVYNLCSGRAVRIRDAALAVADALGASHDRLLFGAIPVRLGETMWQVGDASSFADFAGFVPTFSLQQGIAQTISELGIPLLAEVGT